MIPSTSTALRNQRGVISFDFLFAFILVFAFFTTFVTLTFAVSFIEVAQYVSFAVARTYMAGHLSEPEQKAAALRKFEALQANRAIGGMFRSNWVQMAGEPIVGEFNPEYNSGRQTFFGARLPVRFTVLEKNIPLLGTTTSEDGMVANVQSFLLREPTFLECREFMNRRLDALLRADPTNRYREMLALRPIGGTSDLYAGMLDNGC